jgi:hypothetical protein
MLIECTTTCLYKHQKALLHTHSGGYVSILVVWFNDIQHMHKHPCVSMPYICLPTILYITLKRVGINNSDKTLEQER